MYVPLYSCWLHLCRDGIPFVAVHDSYWTHACFIDEMNRVRIKASQNTKGYDILSF